MKKYRYRPGFLIALILAIPVIGYGIMHLLVYILPLAEDTPVTGMLFSILLIVIGLSVPYWMLKLGLHKAREKNPRERELTLRDIPKDQQQLSQDM